jgi:hypothetical protein
MKVGIFNSTFKNFILNPNNNIAMSIDYEDVIKLIKKSHLDFFENVFWTSL